MEHHNISDSSEADSTNQQLPMVEEIDRKAFPITEAGVKTEESMVQEYPPVYDNKLVKAEPNFPAPSAPTVRQPGGYSVLRGK